MNSRLPRVILVAFSLAYNRAGVKMPVDRDELFRALDVLSSLTEEEIVAINEWYLAGGNIEMLIAALRPYQDVH